MRRPSLICALLVAGTLALYWPALQCGFINFDDPEYVTENPMVTGGLTIDGLHWAFTSRHMGNWDPLNQLSHMLVCEFFGVSPAAHHGASVLLHAANVALLFTVLLRMTGALGASALATALFAWHPLNVEAVAWVSERKGVLSSFFWLLTLLAYARYVERPGRARYALVVAGLVLGLMAKPMLLTLPFALLLLDIWPLKRLGGQPVAWPALRPLAIEKIPLFMIVFLWVGVAVAAQQNIGALADAEKLPLGARLGNALVSYARYLGKAFWPNELSIFYPHPVNWPSWQVAGVAVLLMVASIFACKSLRSKPFLFTGWLWFLGTFIPVIQLIQIGSHSMADRYFYVPGIGLFIAFSWLFQTSFPPASARFRPITAVLLAAACFVATSRQLTHWRTSQALFEHALVVTADNFLAHNNLAHESYAKGNLPEALSHAHAALQIKPASAEVRNTLGSILLALGKVPEATEHLREAVRLRHGHAEAHNNLGMALAAQKQFTAAIEHYREALELRPHYAQAHNNLGGALLELNQPAEALPHFEAALALNPEMLQAHHNLAIALSKLGRMQEALPHYLKAKGAQPGAVKP
ncbi:MAG: tetratricopeptide repeat protein [Verrucomicrobiota bacterium]